MGQEAKDGPGAGVSCEKLTNGRKKHGFSDACKFCIFFKQTSQASKNSLRRGFPTELIHKVIHRVRGYLRPFVILLACQLFEHLLCAA